MDRDTKLTDKNHFLRIWKKEDFELLWDAIGEAVLSSYAKGVAAGLRDAGYNVLLKEQGQAYLRLSITSPTRRGPSDTSGSPR
jgi:hypothetical protein